MKKVALAAALAIATLIGVAITARWAYETRTRDAPPAPSTTVPAAWHAYREGEGHVVHVRDQGIACERCHDTAQPVLAAPRRAVCKGCHEVQAQMQHALAAEPPETSGGIADCVACHSFGPAAESRTWDCMRCHEAPQGGLHAVATHAGERCGTCHAPHAQPAITPAQCTTCHLTSQNHHAGIASTEPTNCLVCHEAHGTAQQARARCTACHDDRPHATFQGHDACTSCHTPHAFDKPAECRACHADAHALAESSVPAHARCTSCHRPHEPKRAGDATCRTCHAQVSPAHPPAGGACLGCHAPHEGASMRAVAMGARAAPSHNQGHHQGRGAPHVPLAQACTSCHRDMPADGAAHGGRAKCVSCHAPHAFAQTDQDIACARCHAAQQRETQAPPHDGHAKCLGCHIGHPHDAELPPTACSTCHRDVHPRKGHAQCTSCHAPHPGTPLAQAVSCKSCHAVEHATATRQPAHADCLTCHAPHDGGKLAAADCKGCHAPKAAQGHGELPGGCAACHGVHAPQGLLATPSCTSCHAPSALPGLHQMPEHRACAKCHTGAHQEPPFATRAICTSCHTQQMNHVPEARLCNGCHVFTR